MNFIKQQAQRNKCYQNKKPPKKEQGTLQKNNSFSSFEQRYMKKLYYEYDMKTNVAKKLLYMDVIQVNKDTTNEISHSLFYS